MNTQENLQRDCRFGDSNFEKFSENFLSGLR